MAILGRVFPHVVDLKGTELILDADADTTITADTDDRIDIKIAGADDFKFTANNFNVLSGSTLTIDSGATITNSGTATNFGVDPESAYAGVLETNANFINQVIFGPAVDGRPWNGLWNKAGVFSSLMLATLEDEGSNAEINIWDLTEASGSAISTSELATVDLSNVEAPSSIAACMGYLIIGNSSTDAVGFAIVDPHSGAWAERTKGWPKTLSTATTPALTNNDVDAVAAGFSDQPAFDPRTGGPMPTFGIGYGTGDDVASLVKDDGNVWDRSGTVGNAGVGFTNGQFVYAMNDAQDGILITTMKISVINADDWDAQRVLRDDGASFGLVADNGLSVVRDSLASASSSGLNSLLYTDYFTGAAGINAITNRAYTTGYMVGDIRGAWLASTSVDSDNEGEKDRSYHANNLTQNGTPTEGPVAGSGGTASELDGYSGFSASVNFTATSNAEWDVITTGAVYLSGWFKSTGNSGNEDLFGFGKTDDAITFFVRLNTSGVITGYDRGATAADRTVASTQTYDDSVWHKIDFVRVSSTERYLYIDGVQVDSDTADAGSLSSTGNLPLAVGVNYDGSSVPASTSSIALVRLTATAPTATQIRQMYDGEKGLFVASAKCTLKSGTTDAVIDVDIDPLTGKIIATQTDKINIFDGLVNVSQPAVNSGASEKGKLWGDLRSEQNAANAYVTAPAVDQRQVNEMVRGLASELPAGVDLSKAKAWAYIIGSGTPAIATSYNIKSVTDNGVGAYRVDFAVPFKSINYVSVGNSVIGSDFNNLSFIQALASRDQKHADYYITRADTGAYIDDVGHCVLFFGELENE